MTARTIALSPRTIRRSVLGACAALLGGCSGVDATELGPRPTRASSYEGPPWWQAVEDGAREARAALEPGLDVQPRGGAFLALPSLPPSPTRWTTEEAFPQLTFSNPTSLHEAPGTGQLLVTEREGAVYAFANDPRTSEKRLVLDLRPITQGNGDAGLLDLAFHPEFGQSGSPNGAYVYVHYAFSSAPRDEPKSTTPVRSRLSRFSLDRDTLVFDLDSELVLIDQRDPSPWHQGGALFFGAEDGFLYVSVGDGGGYRCRFANCQRIDKSLFSGVLRIDVDQRGGSVSQPIAQQPSNATTQGYYIPSDNPFVDSGLLAEFYAIGLRSPHRMTQDAESQSVWIGDVGEEGSEEIDVLARGANYQWPVFEGSARYRGAVPDSPIGIWTGPLLDIPRSDARAVIGGYVYRGQRTPELWGKYVFGDHITGRIWALPFSGTGSAIQAGERELLVRTPFQWGEGITSFALDAAGELYFLTLGDAAKIQRLVLDETRIDAPPLLSQTGAFADVVALEPSPELLPYSVQSPLYSDGAYKRRWAALPSDANAHFEPDGAWGFPDGSVFVKHFELALDERAPERRTRLETRLLVAGEGASYYGLSYKWNAEQDDAVLLEKSELAELEIVQQDGSVRRQSYFFPGPSDCMVCHNFDAGNVLGVRTAQLNGTFLYEQTGRRSNQLVTWSALGLLHVELDPAAIADYTSLANLRDVLRPRDQRVRSYWDSNCSMCHGVQELRARWDARYTTPLAEQGLIEELSATDDGDEAWLVVPGDPLLSVLYQRSASVDPERRMPPLGRTTADAEYVELLREWIEALGQE
jgi:uncharacterized repeat protein (TIGR03806 family)